MVGIRVALLIIMMLVIDSHKKTLTTFQLPNKGIIDESFIYNLFQIEQYLFYYKWIGLRNKINTFEMGGSQSMLAILDQTNVLKKVAKL